MNLVASAKLTAWFFIAVVAGFPFSDPLADGTTVQMASEIALKNGAILLRRRCSLTFCGAGVTVTKCFELVQQAREAGLTVPVVAMGYCNPLLAFGYEKACAEAKRVGIDGALLWVHIRQWWVGGAGLDVTAGVLLPQASSSSTCLPTRLAASWQLPVPTR